MHPRQPKGRQSEKIKEKIDTCVSPDSCEPAGFKSRNDPKSRPPASPKSLPPIGKNSSKSSQGTFV